MPRCRLTRTKAEQALVDWLATDPTGSGDPDFLIIGDLNAYAMEDPVAAIKAAGYTNLTETYIGASAYSYVFEGQFGYLDHVLGNASLVPQVTGVTEWHINADEPRALDYNDYNQPGLYSPDAYRSSDHDPAIVGLSLGMWSKMYLPVALRNWQPTPTPTVPVYCTPPPCDFGAGEVYHCPSTCPGGCGTVCATATPAPSHH